MPGLKGHPAVTFPTDGKDTTLSARQSFYRKQAEDKRWIADTELTLTDPLPFNDGRHSLLQALRPHFFEEKFDAVRHDLCELAQLADQAQLEALAESRTAALEVVSELLSQHVLQNYDKFVGGIDEVGLVEQDLMSAYALAKSARANLRASSTEISTNIKVTRQSRRKQKILDLLDPLLKLQQAKDLHISLKEALQEGDYAQAFRLCVQCSAAMGALGTLRCASLLAVNVDALYDEAAERLETALLAACADFRPDAYCKVLEGYIFLGNVNELGARLTNAFVSAVSNTVRQVVRSVIMTRQGLEDGARTSLPVQDMVRGLPADLFRTCLARALMVVFDMMASHHKMTAFHDTASDLNMSGLAKLREAKRACHARIRQEHSPTMAVQWNELVPGAMPLANSGTGSTNGSGLIKAVSIRDVAPVNTAGSTYGSAAAGRPRESGSPRRRHKPAWAEVLSGGPHLHKTSSKGSQALQLARSLGQAGVRRLGSDEEGQPQSVESFIEVLAAKDALAELQGLEWREAEEVEWGDVLRVSQRGMWASRGFLWEEAARNMACLLACPAAWDGDHFLQVSEWVQRILEAGDAFAGPEGASGLRSLLALQAGNFFAAYHAENLEALHSMLDKELWRRLPSGGAEPGSLWQALADQGRPQKGNVGSFDKILSAGNPWRRKHLRQRLAKQGTALVSFQLGFGGASGLEEDRAARKLEVDEHGIARRVSDDIWSSATSRRTSAATTHAVLSDDEEEELLSGDSLWEDEQASKADDETSAGLRQSGTMPVTNSALKLAKWMQVYGELLRSLRPAQFVFRGMCELFEMYLVHVFVAFSDVSLADMLEADNAEAQQAEAVSPRLRATLVRIAAGSLAKFRASFIAKQQKWLQQLAKEAGGEGSQVLSYLKMKDRTSVVATPASSASAAAALAQLSGSPAAAPKLSHAGNQWGLQERVVAASSLEAFAQQLRQGKSVIQALLPATEQPPLDAFFSRTVDAAGDVSECLLRCGARLNFNLASTAGAISGQFWDLSQPPMQASRWVEDACRQAGYFGEKLRQVAGLTEHHRSQLWCYAGALLAEVILEGVSHIKGRCSAIGRNTISADVQEAMHALKSLAPASAAVAASLEKSSRLVDVYIKAFFLTGVDELGQWAVTHPEYSKEQQLALATAVAQFKGLKKKDQTAFVAQVEAFLMCTNVFVMETRLRLKRKQSEEEAAALQSQILTRSTAKKARASGIATPLFQETSTLVDPVAIERSRQQPPPDRPQSTEVPQARRRASSRARPSTRRQTEPNNTSSKAKGARSPADEEAGPSDAQQRQAETALKEEATQQQAVMERQRRGESDDGNAREGAEDEDKNGQDIFGRNFGSASSALQGLLRKLGAGFDDIVPSGGLSSAQLKGFLVQLRQDDDEAAQLDALSQLNELLSISNEESLSVFPVEQLVPVLVHLLNSEHNPDIMLLAARALTFLADVLPSSCSSIVRHGAVPAFCARLLTIEYIDLAEQSLQALEKLSHEHPQAVLRQGGLVAVLSYLDFFQTGVQRVAVATAATMCRSLTTDNIDAVSSAVPILTNLLQYQDSKVVENACLALSRIAEALAHSPQHLEMLCGAGLVGNAVQLVAVNESGSMTAQLSVSTYYGLIRLLTTCAAGSHSVVESLLTANMSTTMRRLLASSTLFSTPATSASSVLRSSDQLYEVVSLSAELLPPLPDASRIVLEVLPATAESDQPVPGGISDVALRKAFISSNPEILRQYASDLLGLAMQVYGSTVLSTVKNKCLKIIAKVLHFSPPDMLRELLTGLTISSFIAGLLVSRDPPTLASALVLAELLIAKVPDDYRGFFLKEGVVHAMEQLAATAPKEEPKTEPKEGAPKGRSPPLRRSSSRLKGKDKEAKDDAAEAEQPTEPAPPPMALVPKPSPTELLRQAAANRAAAFVQAHFAARHGGSASETEGMRQLRGIGADLGREGAVRELLAALQDQGPASISTFEFLSSGAVKQLRAYLQGEDLAAPTDEQRLLQRLHAFAEEALVPQPAGSPLLAALVRKLHEGLASVERFPVQYSQLTPTAPSLRAFGGASGSAGSRVQDVGSLTSGLQALAQPFKLRLCRGAHESQLRDYSSNVVLIEPLATISAVEDFLWLRVYRSPSSARAGGAQAERGRSPGAAAAEAGAGAASRTAAAARGSQAAAAAATAGEKAAEDAEPPRRSRGARGSKEQEAAPRASKRMTRAQAAKAAAELADPEAEEEEGPPSGDAAAALAAEEEDAAAGAPAAEEDEEAEEEEVIMLQGEHGTEEDEDMEEHDEEGDMQYDDEEEADVEDDEDMGIGNMQVHDMHLADTPGPASATPVAPAAEPASAEPAEPPRTRAGLGRMSYAQATSGTRKGASAGDDRGGGCGAPAAAKLPAGAAGGSGAAAAAAGAAADLAAGHGAAGQQKLRFFLGPTQLAPSSTIFQAVQAARRARQDAEGKSAEQEGEVSALRRGRRMWEEVYTMYYCRYDNPPEEATTSAPAAPDEEMPEASTSASATGMLADSPLADLLSWRNRPVDIGASEQTQDLLQLLKQLEALNRLASQIPSYLDAPPSSSGRSAKTLAPLAREEFISKKLAPKLAQQLKDVLAICGADLPAWCAALVFDYKFMLPFPLRSRYFHCTAFGLARALQHLQQQQAAEGAAAQPPDRDGRELRVGRIQRQKVRISRKRILESATKVFEMYGASRAVLEIEYFGEVGTGLGPTLEFYTMLSHDLQRKGLGMWRGDDSAASKVASGAAVASKADDARVVVSTLPAQAAAGENGRPDAYVQAPQGLFPAPMQQSKATGSKVVERFRLLGRAMAKALQDSRLLDIPLSYTFYRAALRRAIDLYDVRKFDAGLGASLEKLASAHRAWAAAGSRSAALLVDGSPIEDLCLSFVLPGYPEYELIAGGSEVSVDKHNVGDYIKAVVHATLHEGIKAQMQAFRDGFAEVFSLDALQCFHEDELEAMLCGVGEKWSVSKLAETIKCDHGYTQESTAIRYFLEVISELDAADQRRFLRFVTGSPRLPPGGLASLHPRLTVVRKVSAATKEAASPGDGASAAAGGASGARALQAQASTSFAADGDLPSVMTCANYIKLPPYSSKAVARARILFAIREGQGSFDLS